MHLDFSDQQRLLSAQGYVELGMFTEANDEIEGIDPFCRCIPTVLATRLEIYNATQKWDLAHVVAKKLAEFDPDDPQWPVSLAYATRRAESIEAARAILLKALRKHRANATIHYNLACYECQLADVPAARRYLTRAFQLDPKYRAIALDDPDLESMWHSIEHFE
jgi:tetratricopeptide (TPR) repeat protein